MAARKPSRTQPIVTLRRITPNPKTSTDFLTSTTSTSQANKPEKAERIMASKVLFVRSANLNQFLLQKPQRTENPVLATIIQQQITQRPTEETNFEVPIFSSPSPEITPTTTSTADYEYEPEISMSVFNAENQIQ